MRALPIPYRCALSTLLAAAVLPAAAARDPFVPPPMAAGAAAPDRAPVETPAVRHIQVVDGRRYVLDGNRRYTVGDRFGDARIVCIVDNGVVVQDAAALRLLPMFGGIVKRPSDEPADDTARTARTARPDPPLCPQPERDPR